MKAMAAVLAVFLATGCGVDPARIGSHELLADDGQDVRSDGTVELAVLGNFREPAGFPMSLLEPGVARRGVAEDLARDLVEQVEFQHLSFVVLLGDQVRASRTSAWRGFDRRLRNLLEGQAFPDSPRHRVPVLPVAGDGEFRNDRYLRGMNAAFPGVGADIGPNRVATWSAVDIELPGACWRLLVLYSNKATLGPRWQEQLQWIPGAVEGRDFDNLLVFMHHPLVTLAEDQESNLDGAPAELLEAVEESMGLNKLRVVFSSDSSTNEVYLLGGRFGTMHVGAGGGGAPAVDLSRWGSAPGAGLDAIALEPMFDMALVNLFKERTMQGAAPDAALDAALAAGSYKGFTAFFDARHFPVYGYWEVGLDGMNLSLRFRLWQPDGTLRDFYQADYSPEGGWQTG